MYPSICSVPFWIDCYLHFAVPENIHTPTTEGIGISWRRVDWEGSIIPKKLKKCSIKFNWNFQWGEGWGNLGKDLFCG